MHYKINGTYISLKGFPVDKSEPISICLYLRQG